MRIRMNNLSISGVILKGKTIICAQELQLEEFHTAKGRFET